MRSLSAIVDEEVAVWTTAAATQGSLGSHVATVSLPLKEQAVDGKAFLVTPGGSWHVAAFDSAELRELGPKHWTASWAIVRAIDVGAALDAGELDTSTATVEDVAGVISKGLSEGLVCVELVLRMVRVVAWN